MKWKDCDKTRNQRLLSSLEHWFSETKKVFLEDEIDEIRIVEFFRMVQHDLNILKNVFEDRLNECKTLGGGVLKFAVQRLLEGKHWVNEETSDSMKIMQSCYDENLRKGARVRIIDCEKREIVKSSQDDPEEKSE
jgi:hypothetical protein